MDGLAQLVYKDPSILEVDATTAVAAVVQLVEAFPDRDILDMVANMPQLITLPDLKDRIRRTLGKLREIHPSGSIDVVQDIVQVCG